MLIGLYIFIPAVLVLLVDQGSAHVCWYWDKQCCHYRAACPGGPICQYMGDGTLYHHLTSECCADDLEGCNIFCHNCNGCDYHSCRNNLSNRNSLSNAISKKAPVYENSARKLMKGKCQLHLLLKSFGSMLNLMIISCEF